MLPATDLPENLRAAEHALQNRDGWDEDFAWTLLNRVRDEQRGAEEILAVKKETGLADDALERLLLWHATRKALVRVPSLAVDDSVRVMLERELRQLHASDASMVVGTYRFTRAAKLATLRRFPAGPIEWELSGIPRSDLLRASFPDTLRLLAHVLFRVRDWAPCFFMHVAPAPRNRALTVPKEVLRAYYRMVRSLQLQPAVRALVACAWFHDPAAVQDYPHLEVLNRPYVEGGGLIVPLGPAPASSGVLEGNAQRRADYLAGKVQYRYGLAILPRDAAIKWAETHPEFGE